MPSYPPNTDLGSFLETTTIYDVQNIQNMDVNSDQFKDLIVKLRQTLNKVCLAVNQKDTGIYAQTEFACGKTFPPDDTLIAGTPRTSVRRQIFRKTFIEHIVGGLPAGNYPIAHNLGINPNAESIWSFTNIYGIANDTANHRYYPIPYIDNAAGNNITINVDNANININTIAGYANATLIYVVLEYLKF